MAKRSNTEIVLRALEKGITVDIGLQYPIFLGYDNSLVYEYTEEHTVQCDITLTQFIYRCNNLTDAQIVSIIAGVVLKGK